VSYATKTSRRKTVKPNGVVRAGNGDDDCCRVTADGNHCFFREEK
jgi:hypothetical protein